MRREDKTGRREDRKKRIKKRIKNKHHAFSFLSWVSCAIQMFLFFASIFDCRFIDYCCQVDDTSFFLAFKVFQQKQHKWQNRVFKERQGKGRQPQQQKQNTSRSTFIFSSCFCCKIHSLVLEATLRGPSSRCNPSYTLYCLFCSLASSFHRLFCCLLLKSWQSKTMIQY